LVQLFSSWHFGKKEMTTPTPMCAGSAAFQLTATSKEGHSSSAAFQLVAQHNENIGIAINQQVSS